jgi:hypothetical protein
MFTASDTISGQLTIVEHLVRLVTLGTAMEQTGFLLNEVELTDEQLSQLSRQLEACDIQGNFTRCLMGERAISSVTFDQLGNTFISEDRLKCLDFLAQAIAFSEQAPPADRDQLQAFIKKFEVQSKAAAASWSTRPSPLTALLFPSFTAAFNAKSKVLAVRESLLTAIAAERYRHQTGQFPAQLADLVPDYLASARLDPFDGRPLRFKPGESDILIYSIGLDGKDDGGQNSSGNPSEPDIVLRLSSVKARHESN